MATTTHPRATSARLGEQRPAASARFTRQDGVEEQWRVLQPLLDSPPPVHPYAKGTWGPPAAEELIAGHGRWHEPWVPS